MSGNSSTASIPPVPSISPAQSQQGITLVAFVSALATSLAVFAVQLLAFLLLRNKLARIFKPKTYLVPENERTDPPPRSPWGWLFALYRFKDREIIQKCGLDAYFFSRYLKTLLVIFIPLAMTLIPILLPINYIGGRGSDYRQEIINATNATNAKETLASNVKGLDTLAWGNIRPTETDRYWAHLILAVLVIIWVCGVFFLELRIYVRVRQDYLTSAEHRLRASATTVLVSAIPRKWLTEEALTSLYDVFPGGIRNIWINRNFDQLLEKINERKYIFGLLENAQTQLIRMAKKAQLKQMEKEEKLAAKKAKCKIRMTKKDKLQKVKEADVNAEKLAHSGGQSTGEIPSTIDDTFAEEENKKSFQTIRSPMRSLNLHGFSAVSQGIGKAGENLVEGAKYVGRNLEQHLGKANGFMDIQDFPPEDENYDQYGRFIGENSMVRKTTEVEASTADSMPEPPVDVQVPQDSLPIESVTPKKLEEFQDSKPYYRNDDAHDSNSNNHWWEFWKPPPSRFSTPIPAGFVREDSTIHPKTKTKESTFEKGHLNEEKTILNWIMTFLSLKKADTNDYPIAYNVDYNEDSHGAAWQEYVKVKDRPTHRVPLFSWTPRWLPGFPIINKKVDTIYWCRKELARLNLEIEMDQKQPEKFPMMNSAFIQFNNQVAAHMASQSVSYHIPKQMAPRAVEVSPKDVLWENMSVKWWEAWLRSSVVVGVVVAMVILWAFPVAWTASLAQVSTLAYKYVFLRWLESISGNIIQAVAGVLPAIILSVLLMLVPMILKYLAFLQGAQTGTEQQGLLQIYYFVFLFVQVFLVVSISGGALAALGYATNITTIPDTLATQLPKAANYFFSYMILQALSTSSGGLLQIATLLQWYIWPKIVDSTARDKWTRNTTLPTITWGNLFPVYTNFACIALIYSIVAPSIIIFAIITFSLLWIAQRYNMLYVFRLHLDTGGLLYPRAINQTFTGLYVMELCLVGLFFLVQDDNGNQACVPQAIIMIVFLFLTALYQLLLNNSFGPLLHHLPITFENDAVLRDRAFERAQAQRLGLHYDDELDCVLTQNDGTSTKIKNHPSKTKSKLCSTRIVQGAGDWALRSGKNFKSSSLGPCAKLDYDSEDTTALNHDSITKNVIKSNHRRKRRRDLEAQRKIADALYGGYNDDIEDLTPEERDILVKHAFQHSALRARRPTVWIPRDDIGVSDDEIRRTREFAGNNIWISNVGAALDGKTRVVYGRNPPDFSEVDLINL
ncbi:Uncharacterized protein RSN1 [Golovinomyces cichoracearum]|uniref:Uncharacterized protein RSN1 n=1 Tax=Golovinomyces cichoracearum TaxID=62708 RepID=A0A420IBX8_9PEZI|nr:Uncharacterized protein RSN1 [Golovinomyces cichoracearum]